MISVGAGMDGELNAFAQVLRNPSASTAMNEWLDKRLDEKLKVFDAKWEDRFAQMDAKWESRFAQMDAKWESRFDKLEAKLDSKLDIVEFLKEQNRQQRERLDKIQEQLEGKNEEIVALLRGLAAVRVD
jgi:uncharacterized coiled-coil protein SlyX